MTAANRFTLVLPAAGGENAAPSTGAQSLRDSVAAVLEQYFATLDGQPTTNLYQMVLEQVEAPLLQAVLAYTGGNQSRAAAMLGLNRGTLRKKLKQYNLLGEHAR